MIQHQYIHFALNLSYDQYLKVYQGAARNVSVVADDGRREESPFRRAGFNLF
jgi:hypothetical protein